MYKNKHNHKQKIKIIQKNTLFGKKIAIAK